MTEAKEMHNIVYVGKKDLTVYILSGVRLSKVYAEIHIVGRGFSNLTKALMVSKMLERDGMLRYDIAIKEVPMKTKDNKDIEVFEIDILLKRV